MSARADRLVELAVERSLDLLIVGDLVRPSDSSAQSMVNLRWLTGFGGTSGIALIGPQRRTFLTDFRYTERAAREVRDAFDQETVDRQLLPGMIERLGGRVGYDDANTSVKVLRQMEEAAPAGVELIPASGLVEQLRRCKDEAELRAIAEAAKVTDAVYEWLFARRLVGRTELEIRLEAEQRMREMGAEPAWSPLIVAAGENGAIGHHEPSDREIRASEMVVIDMGSVVDGYCSDCTRTISTGPMGDEEAAVYALVLRAQQAGLAAVRPGVSGVAADAAARHPIVTAGYGEQFGHGLGHGVGMEVHEAPRMAQRSDDVILEADVVTVEPGVYLPGRFGVRIEDLVTVTSDGCIPLSSFTKELLEVS